MNFKYLLPDRSLFFHSLNVVFDKEFLFFNIVQLISLLLYGSAICVLFKKSVPSLISCIILL